MNIIQSKKRILIIDDCPIIAHAIASGIAKVDDSIHMVICDNAVDSIAELGKSSWFRIFISLDLDKCRGLHLMRKCHELKITNHCAVTAPKNTQWEAEMKKMGVLGLIKRDSSLKDFERALVSILNGISVWPDLHKVLSKSSCTSYLTRRQEDVLCLLHRGYTSKKIAAQLGLSSGTVNNHVMSLVRSLNATGRTHAVAKAIEFGYIEI